jgi:hypothetical protein
VKLGGFTLLRPNTAAMSCCFLFWESKMAEMQLAGELLIQWFEMNREVLLSRGITIHQLIRNPDAYWIEPSAFVSYETQFFMGDIETRIDGSSIIYFLPVGDVGRASELAEQTMQLAQRFVFLEKPAIDFRRENSFQGIEKDNPEVEIYEIHSVNDYSPILELFITKVTSSTGEPT